MQFDGFRPGRCRRGFEFWVLGTDLFQKAGMKRIGRKADADLEIVQPQCTGKRSVILFGRALFFQRQGKSELQDFPQLFLAGRILGQGIRINLIQGAFTGKGKNFLNKCRIDEHGPVDRKRLGRRIQKVC